MAEQARNPSAQWSRILSELAQDLADTSDSEIFSELLDEGIDPQAEAARIRQLASEVTRESGRQRLESARAELAQHRANRSVPKIALPTDKAREILAEVLKRKDDYGLTLAARKAGELTDSDVQQFLQVLFERGVIDTDGNLT